MRYKEFNTEEYKKDGTYLIRAMTYEQNHSPPHELRAFLAIPEVRKELEKLRFVIKNTPLKLLNKIPRAEIVNDLLLRHDFRISPRGKELIYNYLKGSDQYLEEESPNTLEGSFTEDLVTSKQWLCEKLKNLVKDKSCKTIYILGSWYGNLALFLEKHDINYDQIVLVDKDNDVLKSSEQLLRPLFDMGKLVFLNTDACDMIYDKPGIVINTSVNDMDSSWYEKVPKNMPVLLQARDSVSDSVTKISDFEQFNDMFPMNKVYYLGKKELADPETSYTRYMKIGQK